MSICSFCGNAIKEGTGKMFVYASGKIDFYCSNRCEKQVHKLHKKPLATRWTETFHVENNKQKTKDPKEAQVKKTKDSKK